jgi:putative CocE/NonD family hydrolase
MQAGTRALAAGRTLPSAGTARYRRRQAGDLSMRLLFLIVPGSKRRGLRLALAAMLPLFAWSTASPAAADAQALARPFSIQWSLFIPLRDGVRLHATLYRPVDQRKPLPVIFLMTPYGADRYEDVARYMAMHGYVFASIDVRGRGNSEGAFVPWAGEGRDGADVVKWLAAQPFSDGQVATWGGSYSGKSQWAIAALAGPSLKTIAPAAAGYVGYDMGMLRNIPFPFMQRWLTFVSGKTMNARLYGDDEYWVGAYAELSRGDIPYRDFDILSGNPSPIWREWVAHPEAGGFWGRGAPSDADLARVAIPVLSITGSYDDAHLGTLRYWNAHQDGAARSADRDYLVIGPWDHPGTREPKTSLGGLSFGANSVLDMKQLHVLWYDWIMKDGPKPAFLRDHFVYYVSGRNQWAAAPSLAAATARRESLFLSSERGGASSIAGRGALLGAPPARDRDVYVDDPGAPAHNEGPEGGSAVSAGYLTDAGLIDRLDGDGLIYDTRPFDADTDLVGRPSAELWISMDAPDADIRVQLYEVGKDGKVVFLAQDQMRARYRGGPDRPVPVVPGRTSPYLFDQFAFVARTIRAGSVIRLVVCPLGAGIHNQRNRNSGGIVADETKADNRVARVAVHLGRGMSRIELPFGSASPAIVADLGGLAAASAGSGDAEAGQRRRND